MNDDPRRRPLQIPSREQRQTAQAIEDTYPGTYCWYGLTTGTWWALAGGRLAEADDPKQLELKLRNWKTR